VFEIDDVHQLKWLLLVVACAAAMIYGFAMKGRAMKAFASTHLMDFLAPDVSRPRQYVKAAMLLAAMCAIVLALVGPRFGTYWEDVQQRQLDLVVCLDVSKSMLTEDAGMSRLDRAKDDIKRLLDRLGGGMIGIICFAGRAELTCPLTDDYEFVRLSIDDIGIHSAPLGGTNIGEALASAIKALGDRKAHHRAIILMTDGEDHGKTAVANAQKAHKEGIDVYAIGIGDENRGGLIPVDKDGRHTYMMYDGQQLWSKMDPAALKEIAVAGGGEYQPSRQVNSHQRTLEWIYTERLAPKEERTTLEHRRERKYARFAWPAGLALVLLMIESLMGERRTMPTRRDQSRSNQSRDRKEAPANSANVSLPARQVPASNLAVVALGFTLLFVAPTFAQAPPPAPDDLRAAAAAVKEGNALLSDGKYDDALAKYDEAHGKAPDAPEIAYDRGRPLPTRNQQGRECLSGRHQARPSRTRGEGQIQPGSLRTCRGIGAQRRGAQSARGPHCRRERSGQGHRLLQRRTTDRTEGHRYRDQQGRRRTAQGVSLKEARTTKEGGKEPEFTAVVSTDLAARKTAAFFAAQFSTLVAAAGAKWRPEEGGRAKRG
jgi:Ca-activated chloride channel family protein